MDRRTSLGVVAGLAGAFVLAGGDAQAARDSGGLQAPLTGSVVDVFGSVTGQLAGTLTVDGFVAQGPDLVARGRVSARLTDLSGNGIGVVTNVGVTLPASMYQAICTLLTLELGPISLNLLGLQADLSRVVLTLTATAGGGRLSHLLCTTADQFGAGAPCGALADPLNELVALFAR